MKILLLFLLFQLFHCGAAKNSMPRSSEYSVNDISQKFSKPKNLEARLTRLQYEVTQNDETEPAFQNEYWNHHEEGIYVDIVSGEPLFSSRDKFDSGTGWPSFTQPLVKELVIEKSDYSYGMKRVEVRSKIANSHLGHVFDDGPRPTGLRYCINSASIKFIPKDKLKETGYPEFLSEFGLK